MTTSFRLKILNFPLVRLFFVRRETVETVLSGRHLFINAGFKPGVNERKQVYRIKTALRRTFPVVVLTVLLFTGCQKERQPEGSAGDSSLIKTAYAQTGEQSGGNDEVAASRQNAITRAVARVSPGVVGITVIQVQRFVRVNPFFDDPLWRNLFPELYRDRVQERKVESLGSGFIISPDGYIVTNDHVVGNATEILITTTSGDQYEAELVGSDPLTDIALLKIKGKNFPYIEMGNSADLLVGEWVIALGNPFGLFALNDKPTVTVGVVSAIDRDWGRTDDGRLYMDMIQTDAAINHGNSGGPLVNALGQVIGMNTFIFTGSQYQQGFIGIGFAIPIDKIKDIVAELKAHGSINRNFWVGILDVQTLTPRIANLLGVAVNKGAIITRIDSRGPAYKAGLREEDVIVAIGNTEVSSREDYIQVFGEMDLRVGDRVRILFYRGSQKMTADITLESAPERR